jgi:hypothetical protein
MSSARVSPAGFAVAPKHFSERVVTDSEFGLQEKDRDREDAIASTQNARLRNSAANV